MEVYVIRHTPVAVGNDICYGQSNVPLAESFLQDVEAYRKQLPMDFDAIYSSTAQRCKELAIALGQEPIEYVDALQEMNFGDWENKKWNDIDQEALNTWMVDFVHVKTPNGENLEDLFDRVKIFMDDLRLKDHKKVLLVTHAGVIRCLWSYLLEIPLQHIFKIPVAFHEVFTFSLSADSCMDSIKRVK